MKRNLVWLLNLVLVIALGFTIWLVVERDDENPASATEPTTTTTTEPPNEFVSDGPFASQVRRAITDLDLEAYDDDDWEVGIVRTAEANSVSVITGPAIEVITGSTDCEHTIPKDYFSALLKPDDIVLFDRAGDDHRVCRDEFKLVKEAN